MTRIIPDPAADPQVLAALHLVKAFIPTSLRELRVEVLVVNSEAAPDDAKNLAEFLQYSGYREATLYVHPDLGGERPEVILQILRHELVHAHLHQLDVFVKALIAACPGNRSRKATTEVYEMLRESVADDISYGLGDVVGGLEARAMKDLYQARGNPREQAIW